MDRMSGGPPGNELFPDVGRVLHLTVGRGSLFRLVGSAREAGGRLMRIFLGILAVMTVLMPAVAAAHPHVWVDTRTELQFDTRGQVSAIRVTWRFDELYSAFAIQGSDGNSDGEVSESELHDLAELNVGHLAEWGYFTEVRVGTADAGFLEVTEFGARNEDGTLVMWFVLPLEYPVDPTAVPVRIRSYDPSYYVAFDTDPAVKVALVGDAPAGCRAVAMAAGDQPQNISDADLAALTADGAWASAFAPVVSLRCGD